MGRTQRTRTATRDVVAALLGRRHDALVVQRQAYRVRDEHTDELVCFRSGADYWLAARLGDRVTVWAQNDVDASDDAFDERLARETGWREARHEQQATTRLVA